MLRYYESTYIQSEEIKLSGFTRVEDILNQLPQIEAAESSFLANGATGTATVDLRGFGLIVLRSRKSKVKAKASRDRKSVV